MQICGMTTLSESRYSSHALPRNLLIIDAIKVYVQLKNSKFIAWNTRIVTDIRDSGSILVPKIVFEVLTPTLVHI